MAETRWKRLESLFHEALSLSPEERRRFLESVDHDDPALCRELSSLLLHYRADDEFLESPATPSLRQEAGTPRPVFAAGQCLGPYEIISLLGRGGMGEVYVAHDARLQRKVALKVLSGSLATGQQMERLKHEAQAASGLNHPNILTIYDFGQQGEIQYMVSELVEGISLRSLIGKLSFSEALDYARQAGEALKSAHAAGIIHRDIKPENIMVRSDGYIKVLDFGLAKLGAVLADSGNDFAQTLATTGIATVPGLLLGTINYMSPEQVRGRSVDHRTDIWSWGILFYEMVAGRRPFDGETPGDVLAAILGQEPAPPLQDRQLNRILFRCLAKDPAQRYQSMKDVLLELEQVQRLGSGSKQGFFQPWRWRPGWPAMLSVLLLLVLLAGTAMYFRLRHAKPGLSVAQRPFQVEHVVPITGGANIEQLAVSSDSNYIAYANQEKDGQVLRLHQLGTSAFMQLRPAMEDHYSGISFSAGNKFIYYVVEKNKEGTLYRIPLLGGTPESLITDIDSPVQFSPDGKQFVFFRIDMQKVDAWLMVSSADGRSIKPLFVFHKPEYAYLYPLWSPDGRTVLCGTVEESGTETKIRFKSIHVSDGTVDTVGPVPWSTIHKPAWLKGGRSLAVSATPVGSNFPRIFELSLADGHISPISHEGIDYGDLDSPGASDQLVAMQWRRESSLWLVDVRNPQNARLVPTASRKLYDINWTGAGKVALQIDVEGRPDLWEINVASGDARQLTFDSAVDIQPVVSHDGKVLVYVTDTDGTFHLWKKALGGGPATRLTAGIALENQPVITPDDQWVIYTSTESGRQALWRAPLTGGQPVQLTTSAARKAAISPDGKLVVCEYAAPDGSGWTVALLDAATFRPVRFFKNIPADDTPLQVRWSADGKYLLYVQTSGGVSNIWKQPLYGGRSTQLTHFKEEIIFAFALSPDGASIACMRGARFSDAVLLKSGN